MDTLSSLRLCSQPFNLTIARVRAAKKSITKGGSLPLEDGLTLENEVWAKLGLTEDKREGITAFLDKRRPVFQGKEHIEQIA